MHPQKYLEQVYPYLAPMLTAVGPIELPAKQVHQLEHAVFRTVIGQMLSSKAAASIYAKVLVASRKQNCEPWQLSDRRLRTLGLSGRKIKTIRGFVEGLTARPNEIHSWHDMEYEALLRSVSSFWGLSEWTASMLAIFHFRHSDVVPLSDGTIKRVVNLIEDRLMKKGEKFNSSLASPFGTYLSLSMWASMDKGFWVAQDREMT